jgi:hypothetical protein
LKKSYFILLLIISYSLSGFSQNEEVNFDSEITVLNLLGKNILTSEADDAKHKVNSDYKSALKELINKKGSFDFNFDSLKTISILKSNDLKIYNWAVPLNDGTFEYFAFLQIRKEKDMFRIIELIDKSETTKTPENKILTAKSWYGALYYKLITSKKLGKNYYTLLGWDGNNNLTNKKIIDVINISPNGIIKFGAPVFKTKKKTKKRIIFEYSEDVVMSLKFHQNSERIVFDHLVPASSKLKGIYEYYGPELNIVDAFIIDKGKWIFEGDTDIKLDRNIKDNFWKKPEKAIIK